MNGYLDIHSHILPGVDDGSEDMETTLAMLQMAYDEGVRVMVATPHFYPHGRFPSPEKLDQIYSELQEEAAKRFPDLQLMLGNEIYFKPEALDFLKDNTIHTMNKGHYVLVEFNTRLDYDKIHSAIMALTTNGYYPIIAHVERYSCLHRRADLVSDLHECGAYIQVNCDTFLGGVFDRYTGYAYSLMKQGLVHFLGSDAHDTLQRKPLMEKAVRKLRKKINPDILNKVLVDNPEDFINDRFIK